MGWREWRRGQDALRAMDAAVRRMRTDVEYLGGCVEAAWAGGDRRMAERLNANPRWRRAVDFFLDGWIYRKDMRRWREACGTDGRLWLETRCLGWPRLWRVLLMSRRMRGGDANARLRGRRELS